MSRFSVAAPAAAVYDGGAIAVDTAVGRGSGIGSAEELSAASQAQNVTDDTSAANLECSNTSFHGNDAGERGGALYSTVSLLEYFFKHFL